MTSAQHSFTWARRLHSPYNLGYIFGRRGREPVTAGVHDHRESVPPPELGEDDSEVCCRTAGREAHSR